MVLLSTNLLDLFTNAHTHTHTRTRTHTHTHTPHETHPLPLSQYTLSLDVLEEYSRFRWGALGAAYFRLDGTTNRISREMDMRSFNSPTSAAFLYLISTRAGGQGINLATADIVILYDTCYNPQVDLQAQDRAHRIGQTKQVKIYRLISPSTFEERVLLRARQKLLLDALVIKKAGEGGAGVALLEEERAAVAGGAEDEGGDLGKLSVQELYKMLSHGAEAVFDPTADLRPPPTAEEYDQMLDAATPANVQDDLKEAEVEEAARVEDEATVAEDEAAGGGTTTDGAAPAAAANNTDGDSSHAAKSNEHAASAPVHHTALVNALDGRMRALGMTQKEAAEQIGLKFQAPLCSWMRGVRLSAAKVSQIDVQVATYLASLDPSAMGAFAASDAFAAVSPYLAEPSTMATRFALLDAAHAEAVATTGGGDEGVEADDNVAADETEDEWKPPATTRDHAELLFEIQKHMQTANMNQTQLARRIGVGAGHVSAWLRGGHAHCSSDSNDRARAGMDARAAAYLADPQGVSERCLADEQRRQAAADERERIAAEARAARDAEARSGRKRTSAAPKRFSPPKAAQRSTAPRLPLKHDDSCFSCGDGGDLLECTVCPRTYHLGCVGLSAVPTGTWHCPWHTCIECDRKSSHVGGQLFHCMTCPLTYCFDCAPDAYTEGSAVRTAAAAATAAMLERRGVYSTKSYLFYHCDDCKTEGRRTTVGLAPPTPSLLQQSSQLPQHQVSSDEESRADEESGDDSSGDGNDDWHGKQPASHSQLVAAVRKRMGRGVKQAAIATQMGVSASHLSQWLNGNVSAGSSQSMDAKVAAYLSVHLSSNAAAAPAPVQQRQPSVDPTIDWQSASPSELIATVRNLKQQGVLQGTIATQLGVSASQVSQWLSMQLSATSTKAMDVKVAAYLSLLADATPASAMQPDKASADPPINPNTASASLASGVLEEVTEDQGPAIEQEAAAATLPSHSELVVAVRQLKQQGVSQQTVATQLGVSGARVSQWLNGKLTDGDPKLGGGKAMDAKVAAYLQPFFGGQRDDYDQGAVPAAATQQQQLAPQATLPGPPPAVQAQVQTSVVMHGSSPQDAIMMDAVPPQRLWMRVKVPDCATAGGKLRIKTPDGPMLVSIPDGMVAGQSFDVVLPAKPAPPPPAAPPPRAAPPPLAAPTPPAVSNGNTPAIDAVSTTAGVAAPAVAKTESPCPELGDGWKMVSVKRTREGSTRTDKYYVDPRNDKKYDSLKKAKVAAMVAGASGGGGGGGGGGGARADAGAGEASSSPRDGPPAAAAAAAAGAALVATPLAVAAAAAPITAIARSITAAPPPRSAAAPVTSSATVTGGAPQLLSAGARVKGRYLASSIGKFGTKWWPATVRNVHPDGTCDLLYVDGDLEDGVKPEFVRPFPIL